MSRKFISAFTGTYNVHANEIARGMRQSSISNGDDGGGGGGDDNTSENNSTIPHSYLAGKFQNLSALITGRNVYNVPETIKCVVHFLDDTEHVFEVDRTAKGDELMDAVFRHLELIEREYFALQFTEIFNSGNSSGHPKQPKIGDDSATIAEGQRRPSSDRSSNYDHNPSVMTNPTIVYNKWLDPTKKIRKQMRFCPQPYLLHFRVKFFVTEMSRLLEEYTRYHFYLQLRKDILTGRLFDSSIVAITDAGQTNDSLMAKLASYVLQSELGDYCEEDHLPGYAKQFSFIPNQTEQFCQKAESLHRLHQGQTPADAELNYLEEAKHLELYGVDLHDAKDYEQQDIKIGVSSNGLTVYKNHFTKINTFSWAKIVKISFKRRYFFIQLKHEGTERFDNMIGFNLCSYRACKSLWKSCVEQHTFFRLHTPKPLTKKFFFFFSLGSKFRYSGKTEFQTIEENRKRLTRTERIFIRNNARNATMPASLMNNGDDHHHPNHNHHHQHQQQQPVALKHPPPPHHHHHNNCVGQKAAITDAQKHIVNLKLSNMLAANENRLASQAATTAAVAAATTIINTTTTNNNNNIKNNGKYLCHKQSLSQKHQQHSSLLLSPSMEESSTESLSSSSASSLLGNHNNNNNNNVPMAATISGNHHLVAVNKKLVAVDTAGDCVKPVVTAAAAVLSPSMNAQQPCQISGHHKKTTTTTIINTNNTNNNNNISTSHHRPHRHNSSSSVLRSSTIPATTKAAANTILSSRSSSSSSSTSSSTSSLESSFMPDDNLPNNHDLISINNDNNDDGRSAKHRQKSCDIMKISSNSTNANTSLDGGNTNRSMVLNGCQDVLLKHNNTTNHHHHHHTTIIKIGVNGGGGGGGNAPSLPPPPTSSSSTTIPSTFTTPQAAYAPSSLISLPFIDSMSTASDKTSTSLTNGNGSQTPTLIEDLTKIDDDDDDGGGGRGGGDEDDDKKLLDFVSPIRDLIKELYDDAANVNDNLHNDDDDDGNDNCLSDPNISSDLDSPVHVVQVTMKPVKNKPFGFNVKGGHDQSCPVLVSRVLPDTPADKALPQKLREGDQVMAINGQQVAGLKHEEVVQLIRATKEMGPDAQLVLTIRPNVYYKSCDNAGDDTKEKEANQFSAEESPMHYTPDIFAANMLLPPPPPPSSCASSRFSANIDLAAAASGCCPPDADQFSDDIGEEEYDDVDDGDDGEEEEPDMPRPEEEEEIPIVMAESPEKLLKISMNLLKEGLQEDSLILHFEYLPRRNDDEPITVARDVDNVPKNRYLDIAPYDSTRVVLKECNSGDYINASHVTMEVEASGVINRFIATQGPLKRTISDFWQMVWEQRSTLIVMVTPLVEDGRKKCFKYWPDEGQTMVVNDLIDLVQVDCQDCGAFLERRFKMIDPENKETHYVTHLQYLAWPDQGVPDDDRDFLKLIFKVRELRTEYPDRPVIVHCSAGIGRTGVLILMETGICLIEANQPVYPLELVRVMRNQRAMLIQTTTQFRFVCEALYRVYRDEIVKPLDRFLPHNFPPPPSSTSPSPLCQDNNGDDDDNGDGSEPS